MGKSKCYPICALIALCSQMAVAQCIDDIYYLINSPKPCLFVGAVGANSIDCFDPTTYPSWKYKWTIKNAKSGALVASYQGMAFAHQFTKFGGYEFCLEIDKDADPTTPPDLVECQTYTTCEICSDAEITFDYKDCSSLEGCEVELKAKIEAANAIGLRPTATFIVSYIPTPQEGPSAAFELVFKDIPVQYQASTGIIQVSEGITVPYVRGCYQPRLEFGLEHGAGAHFISGGAGCDLISLHSEKVFRCMACGIESGKCANSIKATKISNETGTCVAQGCILDRDGESEEAEINNHFSVYPNPANEYLVLSSGLPMNSDCTIALFDSFGRQAYFEKWEKGQAETSINVAHLPAGTYQLNLLQEGQALSSKRIAIIK